MIGLPLLATNWQTDKNQRRRSKKNGGQLNTGRRFYLDWCRSPESNRDGVAPGGF